MAKKIKTEEATSPVVEPQKTERVEAQPTKPEAVPVTDENRARRKALAAAWDVLTLVEQGGPPRAASYCARAKNALLLVIEAL
jgi:hypothetical protein